MCYNYDDIILIILFYEVIHVKSLKIILSIIIVISLYTTIITQPVKVNDVHAPSSYEFVEMKKQEGYIGVINNVNTLLTLLLLLSFSWITTATSINYWRIAKLFLSSFIPILKQRFNLYPRVFNSRLVVFFLKSNK